MDWYKRYMGDYAVDTADLSMTQDGAYTRLLDRYYTSGDPLPADKQSLYRITRAFERWEREAVDSVLAKFFILTSAGYTQKRTEKELAKYKKAADKHIANLGRKMDSQNRPEKLEARNQIKEKSKECAQKPRTPAPKQPFVAPSLQMVALDMVARGIADPDQEAKLFVDYHANRKWRFRDGKGAVMVDWRKAVTTWQGNIGRFAGSGRVSAREQSVRSEAYVGAGPQVPEHPMCDSPSCKLCAYRRKVRERDARPVPNVREVDPKLRNLVQGVAARKGL